MTSSHDVPPVQFTGNELATVLAALRHWQAQLRANAELPGSYPQFDGFPPLSETQIDQLCERLNLSQRTVRLRAAAGLLQRRAGNYRPDRERPAGSWGGRGALRPLPALRFGR